MKERSDMYHHYGQVEAMRKEAALSVIQVSAWWYDHIWECFIWLSVEECGWCIKSIPSPFLVLLFPLVWILPAHEPRYFPDVIKRFSFQASGFHMTLGLLSRQDEEEGWEDLAKVWFEQTFGFLIYMLNSVNQRANLFKQRLVKLFENILIKCEAYLHIYPLGGVATGGLRQ